MAGWLQCDACQLLLQANMPEEAARYFAAALDKPRGWRREGAYEGLCKVGGTLWLWLLLVPYCIY